MRHARNTLTLCAVLGILVLSGCGNDEPDQGTTPPPPPSTATTPPPGAGGPTPLPEEPQPTLEPGEYAFEVGGAGSATLPQPVVDVPAGYWSPGPYIVYAGTDDQDALGSLSFWYTNETVDDPCHHNTSTRSTLGPTTRDVLTALTRRPTIRSSEPRPVTIGGHDGYYLTLQLRRTVDLDKCDDGYALLAGADPAFVVGPDQYRLGHYWILDVGGRTIIMIAGQPAGDDPSETAKILDLARSAHFIEPADL